MTLRLGAFVCLAFAAIGRLHAAEQVTVAAAANLVYVLDPLDAEFERSEPDVKVTPEIGASGGLVAQIANGAPYDVFLSADMDFPRALITKGGAEESSLVTVAYGKLVLWSTRKDLSVSSVEAVVGNPTVTKIAIANPKSAPYGEAAEEVLKSLGLSEAARPKIVYGENISQTAQYVAQGGVDAGFVALSLVLSPKLKDKGHWIEIPAKLYKPLAQGGVLTKRGADNPAARRYLLFLGTPAARAILERFGYGVP